MVNSIVCVYFRCSTLSSHIVPLPYFRAKFSYLDESRILIGFMVTAFSIHQSHLCVFSTHILKSLTLIRYIGSYHPSLVIPLQILLDWKMKFLFLRMVHIDLHTFSLIAHCFSDPESILFKPFQVGYSIIYSQKVFIWLIQLCFPTTSTRLGHEVDKQISGDIGDLFWVIF